MPLLEAFLAMALTMLSFAMVATLLVELGQRVVKTRARDLRTMLDSYYEEQLKPLAEAELGEKYADLVQYKKEFIDGLLTNPLLNKSESLSFLKTLIKPRYFVKPLVELSAEDFFKKLATTEIGLSIKERGELEIDEVVDSLSMGYDKYCSAASDIFKRRAQLVSLGAGLLVAVSLNVNAFVVLESYMHDPVLRDRVVARAEQITAQYEAVQAREEAQGFKNPEEVKALLTEISSNVDDLEESGVAFGWKSESAPQKFWIGKTSPQFSLPEKLGGSLFWLVGALGTGMLVGLGCPFWFNIVSKITSVLRTVRGGGGSGKVANENPEEPDFLKENRAVFKVTGGAPTAMRFRAVERMIKSVAKDWQEADRAAQEDPTSGTKADLAAVFQQALVREINKHRELLRKASNFPAGAFEDPSRWVLDDSCE